MTQSRYFIFNNDMRQVYFFSKIVYLHVREAFFSSPTADTQCSSDRAVSARKSSKNIS